MNTLDHTKQEQLYISAYWPSQMKDEHAVGYAIAKDVLVYRSIGIIFSLLSSLFSLFFPNPIKNVNANPYDKRRGVFAVDKIGLNLLIDLLALRHRKLAGFYQLDAQGNPTIFIGKKPPKSILGRVGVNRKQFLQKI
jgi:hypothetical protein